MPKQMADIPVLLRLLPDRVRELRLARNLTQVEVARLAGIAPARVSRLEAGLRLGGLTVANVIRIADALAVPIGELFGQPQVVAHVSNIDELNAVGQAARMPRQLPARKRASKPDKPEHGATPGKKRHA